MVSPQPQSAQRATSRVVSRPSGHERRLREIIDREYEFVWRSLRRLGVRESDADDSTQKVFMVASEKLNAIGLGSERAFLFQTALRVAAHARRSYRRERTVLGDGESEVDGEDPNPGLDELLEQKRLREQVDLVLDAMPMQLRAVLVLYEVEQMTAPEIARLLGIALGTVASRLRRAREAFVTLAHGNANTSGLQGGDA
jgi:RNA polymerase sigma-70 factor, ECF subfamily